MCAPQLFQKHFFAIGLPSFGLEVCVWEGGAHEVQSKGLEASERALA